ncbi:LysR family transcriptional regulator [Pseudomonas plecoglossicida]|uniref:LysR family transcriptional regulator n=4 Tax=Pseudomonas TaxID=286 RepID=A0AAJ5LKC1_9PSED|nr:MULTISPECIES: LysR family transcriptional regulator [Pseudomonas]TXI04780.1 MAG: LysR family transcriptional regulator [Pseudomonas monteilii]GJB79209.1 transcriptional regulator [Aeromonas caviae]AGA75405.1 LysR family transcriptional regulator [Pseudomonas putida HB3267]KPM64578.1 LysR family transcriptional regulator [Pseudomonas putida]KYC15217.1 LysR family transcriptional regulator [Pseudomonas sp. ABFPK]
MKTRSEELQVFVTVIDCGSISAAAEQMGQTPSAVSRTLSRLEGKLGTTLVNRTTRRMDLTEEGRFFLERARLILEQMDEMEERLSMNRQTPTGRLRINAAAPFMLHAILPWIGEFRRQYPGIELELNTDDLIIDLLEQSTDVAIRIGELADSSLHARSLGCSPVQVLASPAYLEQHGTPQRVEDLANHCLLGFSQPESLNHWPLRHAQGDRWSIRPSLIASSGETLRQLALAGEGIVSLSHFMTHEDIRAGRLQVLLSEANNGYRQPIHAVYYRNTQLALRIQCFLDFIQRKLAMYAS